MNRKENVLDEEEEKSLRKRFKSNDDDADEEIGNEEEENLDETAPESDLDMHTEQSKHEQLFGIKTRINIEFKRFQAVLKKMFAFF